MAELFTWKGFDSQGKEITVQNLTWEEVQGMETQEKEYLAKKEQLQSQQQTDAKLAPVVNKAVSDYAKSKGITQADLSGTWQPKQYAKGGETVPGMNGQADSTAVPGQAIARAADPVSKAFADLSTSSEEGPPVPTTENGMLEGPPAPKSAAFGPIINVGAPVTAGMAAEAQQPAPTQPKGSLASMLDDIPDEVAQPLLIQYHNGVIKPDEFFKQVVAIKKSLLAIKQTAAVEKTKQDYAVEGQKVQDAGAMARTEASEAGALERTKIDAASREAIAEANRRAEKEKADADKAYSERTKLLTPPQMSEITSYRNALTSLNAISNLYKDKYVGLFNNAEGTLKQKLGLLGTDEATFRSGLFELQNMTLKDRSGAAVTVPEFERFKKEIANLNASPKQFIAILERQKDFLQNRLSTTIDGYDRIGKNVTGLMDLKAPIEDYYSGVSGELTTTSPAAGMKTVKAPVSPEKRALAMQALEDPEAPPEVKIRAKELLSR